MTIDHSIEQLPGSQFNRNDLIQQGLLYNVANPSSAGPIASVAVTVPGSYATLPTFGTSGAGSGATLVGHMGALTASLATAGTGYVATEAVTLTGGTAATNAVMTVTNIKLVSLAINAGGSGYAVGDTIVLNGGTHSVSAVVTVLSLSTTAVATFSITTAGVYTTGATTFTQASTSGSGTGATFQTGVFGINAFTVSTAGSYTVLPSNPVSQGSTTGSGTGATFTINTWKIGTVTVSAGGTLYNSASALTVTGGGSTGGGAGTLTLTNTGISVTVPVTTLTTLPPNYAVNVTPSQACFISVNTKTSNSFNVVLKPITSSDVITAGTFDVTVLG